MLKNLLLLVLLAHGSLGYLLSHSEHFSHHQTGPDKCIECKSEHGRYDCDREDYCRDGEVCFRQEYLKDGQTFYHAGCTDMRNCDSLRKRSHHWEYSHEHFKDGACCSTTNCNTQSLLMTKKPTTTSQPTTTTSTTTASTPTKPSTAAFKPSPPTKGVVYCQKCVTEDTQVNCKPEMCSTNEIQACFTIKEHQVGLPVDYKSGCIGQRYCDGIEAPLQSTLLTRQGQCCHTDLCNDKSVTVLKAITTGTNHAMAITSTTTYLTATTTTTPTATKAASTTMATTFTAATIGNISTSEPIKTPEIGNVCEVCSDKNCKNHISYQCPEIYPLCLTSVKNEGGNVSYEKRCASFSECAERWLIKSSLKPECTSLGQNTTFGPGIDCTFCCDADSCNKDTVPPAETLSFSETRSSQNK